MLLWQILGMLGSFINSINGLIFLANARYVL